jgi:hypothetical protein
MRNLFWRLAPSPCSDRNRVPILLDPLDTTNSYWKAFYVENVQCLYTKRSDVSETGFVSVFR